MAQTSSRSRYRDLRAILDAAGHHDPTPEELRRGQRALGQFLAAAAPSLVTTRDRWKRRALRLRDRHEPGSDWGAEELYDGDIE